MEIARAGITRARGLQYQARSELFPQLSGSAGYTRALASEFQSVGGGGADTTMTGPTTGPCGRFVPRPGLPADQRLDSLEHAVDCAVNSNPFAAFGDLPFGRENTWRLGLNLSQTVFSGGRVSAQGRIARVGRETAEIGLATTKAQVLLDVTQAYYDAALSDRLVRIAEATLEQSEGTLRQTRLARQVGNQPEFDLLRAQVARDNLRPVLIQRRAMRDLAYLRLKQLLDLPADGPVALVTPLAEDVPVGDARQATIRSVAQGDSVAALRAPVRQAEAAVRVQEQQLRIVRSQRLPSVRLSSDYGRVAYPEGIAPGWSDFRSNWTVGAAMQVPLLTGGRIRGEVMVAQAALAESRARLRQTQELSVLDTRDALERLRAAQATWEASSGTVEQAQRAHRIAEVRYAEGISTQLELADARLLLQQAEANRAQAARDLQVARARVALLPDLPLGSGGGSAAQQQGQDTSGPQQDTQQQAPRGGAAQTSQSSFPGAGER